MIKKFVNKIIYGDTLQTLKEFPAACIDTIITSPPYWGLRDYGIEGQLGLEPTLEEYIEKLLKITIELKRVLKKSGVMFWNHGDCYGGNLSAPNQPKLGKRDPYSNFPRVRARNRVPKCLCLQNYRLILKLVDEQGWILRNDIIWWKPNHMPSSIKDRFTNSYEPIFFLVKNKKYWFDLDAVRVPITTFENRPMGIDREKDYPNAKRNKNCFNYRVREAKKGHIGIIGVKSTEEEMERYDKKGQTKILQEQAESFGSPRARKYRTGYEGGRKTRKSPNPNEPNAFHNLGKNPGDMWRIPTQPFPEAHFATFPMKLIEPMIKVGCPPRGIVLDPFIGSGTTAIAAKKLGRTFVGIDLNPDYIKIAEKRLSKVEKPLFLENV